LLTQQGVDVARRTAEPEIGERGVDPAGAMAFTRTPKGPNSLAAERVRLFTPDLVAA
jgi:hypothetical protein